MLTIYIMSAGLQSRYKKIVSKEQLKGVIPGTILVKYPALGLPEAEIDLSDDTRYLRYEVHTISHSTIELQIPGFEIASSIQDNKIPHMNGRSDEASVLVKEFSVLISEQLWWVVS